MATYTPNLNLKKPSTGELYDVVADLNDSKDKIDKNVGAISVKLFGATGDGITDDTKSIQDTIDSNVGIVLIPDGIYMIDGNYGNYPDGYGGIAMGSNQKLLLSPNAVLKCITNEISSYSIIRFDGCINSSIEGGTIEGERLTHVGDTGEWGHGIYVRGSQHITIKDTITKNCWGDGICIGANTDGTPSEHVHLNNVISDNNRRQGLTIGKVYHITAKDSIFSNTNGTMPMAGIDIEPNAGDGSAFDVRIESCRIFGNQYMGIEAHFCDDVIVRDCNIYDNLGGIYLLGDALRPAKILSIGNTFKNNLSHIKPNDYCVLKSQSDIFQAVYPTGTGAFLFDGVPANRRVEILDAKFNQNGSMWHIYWNTSEANTILIVDGCTFHLHGASGYENYYGKFLSFSNNKFIVESDYVATAALENKYPIYFRNSVLVENCKFLNLGTILLRLGANPGVMTVIDCIFSPNFGFIKPDMTEVNAYYHGN